jgi:hypothetical protein
MDRVLLEKLIVAQLGFITRSQEYDFGPYSHPEEPQSTPLQQPISRSILILYSYLRLGLPSALFLSASLNKVLYDFSSLSCVLHVPPFHLVCVCIIMYVCMSEMDIVTFINNVNHCIFELEKYRPTEE